jgi:hypothetical protein
LPATLPFDSSLGISSYEPELPIDIYSKLVIFKGSFKCITIVIYGTPLSSSSTSLPRSPSMQSASTSETAGKPVAGSFSPEGVSPPRQQDSPTRKKLASVLRRQSYLKDQGLFQVGSYDLSVDFSLDLANDLGFSSDFVDESVEVFFSKGSPGRIDLDRERTHELLASCLSWSNEKFAKLSDNGLRKLCEALQHEWNKVKDWVRGTGWFGVLSTSDYVLLSWTGTSLNGSLRLWKKS